MKLKSAVDITSAVDIVFLLVIFFMVSSTFIMNPGMKIDLPKSKTADARPGKDIVITVKPNDSIFVNSDPVRIDSLAEVLRRRVREENKDMVIIRGDRTIPYQTLIAVMDACRSIGITRINLSTEKE
jgi:biopolymer transport protein ExbD